MRIGNCFCERWVVAGRHVLMGFANVVNGVAHRFRAAPLELDAFSLRTGYKQIAPTELASAGSATCL
jgi:hypothetical protein